MPVRVTKVTIEYEFQDKPRSVSFSDPSRLGAIVFNRRDALRLREKQFEVTGEEIVDQDFKLGDPLQSFVDGALEKSDAVTHPADMSIWWHTTACLWFHPENDQV